MPFPLIPLAIGALGAIGSLIQRRRQSQAMRGAAFSGSATATPTSGVSDTTTGPNTAQTPAGAANTGTTPAAQTVSQDAAQVVSAAPVGNRPPVPTTPATGPQQPQGDPGLAARMGEASIARTRATNRRQRTALSQNSLSGT